jgi:UDP-galactopyranose mutase
MDELSAFKFAPKELKVLESQLMQRSDIVFTGGHSLYQAKKDQHYNIYPFPSSIDKKHFGRARRKKISEPADQAIIREPKIGFYGVIDERFDINLIENIARKRPDWQIILIGPVVKIDPDTLPRYANIHYLGSRSYDQLPEYLSGWQVALIPFLLNESTRFISPTKTPEYLAGGIPVVSTPITDVVEPYSTRNLVSIASDATGFIRAIEKELSKGDDETWLKEVDAFLSTNSWENTCEDMLKLMSDTFTNERDISIAS